MFEMEIVIRVASFYALEKVYNSISYITPDLNSFSSNIATAIGNSNLGSDEPRSCLADERYPNSPKTNLLHIFIITLCMVLVTTPRQALRRILTWLTPTLLLLWSLDHVYHCTVTLNKYSATALRLVTFGVVCYWIFYQIVLKRRQTKNTFRILKCLIPLTLLFSSFYYYYGHNVVLSSYSLMALRVTTFLIVTYSFYVKQQQDMTTEATVLFFFCFTFGLKNAEFQFIKYAPLFRLMLEASPRSAKKFQKSYSLILIICFIIDWLFLNCACNFQNLLEGKCLEEIYYTESLTVVRSFIAFDLLPYFNNLIFEAVQFKLLRVADFNLRPEFLFSMISIEFFAIDSRFWNLTNESRLNVLQICFLINFGELLSNFSGLACFILNSANKGEKLLICSLIMSLFTYSSAVIMLVYSLCTFTFSVHLFIIVILAIYVIIINILSVSRYAAIEIEPFKSSVEIVNRVRLIEFSKVMIKSCLYISLSVSWFLIALSERVFAITIFEGSLNFAHKAIQYIDVNIAFVEEFIKARLFMYFISESEPEVLKELDDVCSICREEMLSACVTPCNHHYHKHCLLSCLYDVNKCPLCQCELYTKSVHDGFLDNVLNWSAFFFLIFLVHVQVVGNV